MILAWNFYPVSFKFWWVVVVFWEEVQASNKNNLRGERGEKEEKEERERRVRERKKR